MSYGYGGTGKISQNSEFKDYGVPFQLNDVVGVSLVGFTFNQSLLLFEEVLYNFFWN